MVRQCDMDRQAHLTRLHAKRVLCITTLVLAAVMALALAALLVGRADSVGLCPGGIFAAETLVGVLKGRILTKPLAGRLPGYIRMPVGLVANMAMIGELVRGFITLRG